ncbi:hypothetical protein CONPUDRAFT_163818, partial [Coniophora puteana RWD-64-598 SS2]
MVPEYWRRVILPLESPLLSPSVLDAYFAASAPAGIHFNLRASYHQTIVMDAAHENARVAMLVRALLPHLDRCYALYLTLMYRSSTIVASAILDGASAANLAVLCVESFVADTQAPLRLRYLRCPSVNKVSLDARSFVDFVHASKTWEEWNSSCMSVQADFLRYRPPHGAPGLSPAALVEALFILNDARGSGDLRLLNRFTGTLLFQHIDSSFISTHFPWRSIPNASVMLVDCTVPTPLP